MKANEVSQLTTLLLATAFSLISCEKESRPSNKPPIANAGRDTSIMLPEDKVNLDGSASYDPDGKITKFLWRKISGGNSSITDQQSPKFNVTNLSPGTYQFELKVTDNGGLSSQDTLTVEVLGPGQTTSPNYFRNLTWIFPWYATLEIRNIYSYVTQGIPLKVFIQRGSDPTWIEVQPLTADPNNNTYEYFIENRVDFVMYNYGSLIIFYYGADVKDSPTVKVEF